MPRSVALRLLAVLALALGALAPAARAQDALAQNPVLWADVPDPSVIRVGDTYYMSSTTMHMAPGVPIMTSPNLVDWEIAGYAYDTLGDTDALALRNGQSAYGRGSWASSLRYHDGTFYVFTFSYTTGQTYLFTTDDVEGGDWARTEFGDLYHDPGLFFDDDGRVYLVYGATDIRIVELTEDATAVQPGGLNELIIEDAGSIAGDEFYVPGEGAHVYKIDGWYYLFLITWPQGSGRSQLVYRSPSLTGPWEGRVALNSNGVAQGGIVDTPDGAWYAMLFRDSGSVGRIPYLVPVEWEDGWPLFGVERGFPPRRGVPQTLDIPSDGTGIRGIVSSDEFDGARADLDLAWQWNHNPAETYWSLSERPGWLRLTTDRLDASVVETRNTLTQRTFGPKSEAVTKLDVTGLNDGDVAGLGLLQENYGFVGVTKAGGTTLIVMVNASGGEATEVERVPLTQDVVHLRTVADFQNQVDRAIFSYSLDGETWTRIGDTLQMSYTLGHFMGYRFGLFAYATGTPGGTADFDYFRLGGSAFGTSGGTGPDVGVGLRLDGGSPNPFRETSEIAYEVSTDEPVRLDVYDALGRHVRTLADGPHARGRYTATLSADDLSSGVYLVRLTAGDARRSARVTLVR